MRIIGVLTKTSRDGLFVLEGNSSRFLVKENLPASLVNKTIIAYGTINIKLNEKGMVTFFNPKAIFSLNGQELWRASKASSSQNPTEEFSPDDGFF